ncbi:MAG: hypothetical protein HY315_02925 [Acidobacteria bacterium]|nr:hypothetical protein [Acidobacteriota bacterium]
MLTLQELQELKQRLYQAVCPICAERKADGTCGLAPEEHCPIFFHVPRLVEASRSIQSDRPGDCVERVRQEICAKCRGALLPVSDSDMRQTPERAPDAYLLLIARMIEDFLAEKAWPDVIMRPC